MNVVERWVAEMECEDVVALGYIIGGLPENWYAEEDNLQEALDDALDEFCRKHGYSEKTWDKLINTIEVRDAFYKMVQRQGFKLPSDLAEEEKKVAVRTKP